VEFRTQYLPKGNQCTATFGVTALKPNLVLQLARLHFIGSPYSTLQFDVAAWLQLVWCRVQAKRQNRLGWSDTTSMRDQSWKRRT